MEVFNLTEDNKGTIVWPASEAPYTLEVKDNEDADWRVLKEG